MNAQPSAVPAETIRKQIEAILGAWHIREQDCLVIAEVMTQTDLWGIESHGLSMLPLYERMWRAGRLNVQALPRMVRETASTALIDADAGLGHGAAVMAMELAIEKAITHDIGWVSVCNSHHFGAAGYYARLASDRNLIGFVSSSARSVCVVPTFGSEPVLGTNPLAFAIPAQRHPPVVVDIATSAVAMNKVRIYASQGMDIPDGWVVDGSGQPVTDAAMAYQLLSAARDGGLAPVGGTRELGSHKGYGLGLMAQILGSTLAGGSFSPIRNRTQSASDPDNIGHCFMALNPASFRPFDEFTADVDEIIDTLKTTRPSDPAKPVLVPGDPEREAYQRRQAEGIPVQASLKAELRKIAEASGAPYLLG
jgi:LDH2 family malate/lactate/ureidoglycolate dehydrogenase